MKRRFGITFALGLAAALAITTTAGLATAPAGAKPVEPAGRDGAAVVTDAGPVRGTVHPNHRTFQGIPYAAPPVGKLRWASPGPVARWTTPRDATRPGNDCPQTAGFLGDPASTTEDCLYLNVTTPRGAAGRLLPVIFYIHGGGFFSGSGRLYGAEQLATQGDAVVVTANYRLGAFGFLAHPALGGGRSGTFGLQDQQAALRWVHRNAAAFGGDPHNVTLVGESAGSVSICAHLVAPSSAGLFQRAVMQSGPCSVTTEWPYYNRGGNWYPRPREIAMREGAALAARLDCNDPAVVAACLRGKPAAAVLEASDGGQGFGPMHGGSLLPIGPAQALKAGRFARVPVIHGTTRDEHRMFIAALEAFSGHVVTADDYRAEIRSVLGAQAERVLARYPLADYASPALALATVWTDRAWACPALATDRAFARHVPTYAFEFADDHAPWVRDTPLPSFPPGAFHAGELQYLFHDEQFPGPATRAQQRLADRMISYWSTFAHTGDPNRADTPTWSRFQGSRALVQSLAPSAGGIRPVNLDREHRCDFWASLNDN